MRYAQVDNKFNVIEGSEKYIDCDLVVLSVGLAPEHDIVSNAEINPVTGGFVVNEFRETSEGIFACGNVLQVHDLVDNVTAESQTAGRNAGLYALGQLTRGKECTISAGNGVRYVVPSTYYQGDGNLEVYFRVTNKYVNANINVSCNGEVVLSKFVMALNPGEMVSVVIDKTKLNNDIEVSIKER